MFGSGFGGQENDNKKKKKYDKNGHEISEELASHIPTEGVTGIGPMSNTGAIESLLVDDEEKKSAE